MGVGVRVKTQPGTFSLSSGFLFLFQKMELYTSNYRFFKLDGGAMFGVNQVALGPRTNPLTRIIFVYLGMAQL